MTRTLTLDETLAWLAERFPGKVAFSTSFGQEDQVITHLIRSGGHPIRVFTLDTGRLFQETYDVWEKTQERYPKPIEAWFPDTAQARELLQTAGPNSFYRSVAERKACCNIRKVIPLRQALRGVEIWITGLRAGQSANRNTIAQFEIDEKFGLIKFNPLCDWDLNQVESFLEAHEIPQNSLHAQGFVSIGCAPCTRAIQPGEDIRAGRWWWEENTKECGLHADYFTPTKA